MGEMCTAPDGSSASFLSLTPTRIVWLVTILGFTPITIILLGPRLIFWFGGILGFYLKKKTAGRKAQILEVVESEEEAWLKEGKGRRDSEEWETVDAYTIGTAGNGEQGEKEWDGIVGFFHPFWYVLVLKQIIMPLAQALMDL
jgi:alpha-1,2-mannosyltransferase